jgi:hypothetical protein
VCSPSPDGANPATQSALTAGPGYQLGPDRGLATLERFAQYRGIGLFAAAEELLSGKLDP